MHARVRECLPLAGRQPRHDERHEPRVQLDVVHTRGAVASLARFDTSAGTLTWLGVGNVEGVLFRHLPDGSVKKEGMALRGGVVGYMLPPLTQSTFELNAGDTLVLATDGLAGAFMDNIVYENKLPVIAESLMREFRKPGDDALVVAARYLGGGES